MIGFDDVLLRLRGLERGELVRWVENGWILPEKHAGGWVFHDLDVARVELILTIRRDFAIDDEALPLILGLLDQVYSLRRQMHLLCRAVAAQPAEVQSSIREILPKINREGG